MKKPTGYFLETNFRYSLYHPNKDTEVVSPCSCPGCKPVSLEKVLNKVRKIALSVAGVIDSFNYRRSGKLLWVVKVETTSVQVDTVYIGGEAIRSLDVFTFTILVAADKPGQLENLMSKKPNGVFYRAWGREGVRWSMVKSGHNYNKYIDLYPERITGPDLASQLAQFFRFIR